MLEAIDRVRRAILVLLGAGAYVHPSSAAAARSGDSPVPQVASDLAVVRQSRILFSHHSVGANILEGLARLDAEYPGRDRLRVVELGQAASTVGPIWIDVSGGENTDPISKIDFFASVLRKPGGAKPDVAMMKLCFVDFEPRTNVDSLFNYYRSTVESLKRELSGTRILHVTVPLTRHPDDLKSKVRRLIGKEVWEDAANVKRADFNRRLKESFKSDSVFELARAEATAPDGTITTFDFRGQHYLSLYPGYTEDGGHLNPLAQRVVGSAMLRFLANTLGGPTA